MYTDILAQASNIKINDTREYTVEKFLSVYPQFGGDMVPRPMIEGYAKLASQIISPKRYGAYWEMASGLFVAHFCTLFLQSMKPEGATALAVLSAAATAGVVTSESADGVSHSMDTGSLMSDLNGWAAFKLTTFGVQFATIAKMVGKGGMYVW